MALNIYFEARNQPLEGQYAVADVVMHRLKHFNYPNTICGVVEEGQYYSWNPNILKRHGCQFSWFCDGKSDKPIDGEAFLVAEYITQDVLTNPNYEPVLDYAIYYHADYVTPKWSFVKEFVTKIGIQKFYF